MPTDIERTVYRTLAYFSHFKYPLTQFEVWKWLLEPGQKVSLQSVIKVLDTSHWLQNRVQRYQGFYALGDAAEWHHERHIRFLDAMRKYKKAERAVQLLGRLPWVEGIAVCNSLSWYQTNAESDIDFFVIAKLGRIWSTRLLLTIPTMLLRQRPGEAASDPICLSFFCTQAAFDFAKLKIASSDPYLAYWCRSLVPLTDHSNWLQKFSEQNAWLATALPHATNMRRAWRFRSSTRLRLPWLPISENLPKQLQFERFPSTIRELMNKDTRVVVTDEILKFHGQDTRELILLRLKNKMDAYEEIC